MNTAQQTDWVPGVYRVSCSMLPKDGDLAMLRLKNLYDESGFLGVCTRVGPQVDFEQEVELTSGINTVTCIISPFVNATFDLVVIQKC